MKGSSNDNSKISDSGYTNTCVSQSHNTSGSSGNSNRFESSGYVSAHPSALGSSNDAFPRPITKKKSEERKKNKSKTSTVLEADVSDHGTRTESGHRKNVESYDVNESSSDFSSNCKKSEEVAHVDSTDPTDLGENNVDSSSTEPNGGVGSKTNNSEDISSNANVFVAVISLYNGLVIDVTPTVKTITGYTKKEWCGRSFIDFVHPNDKSMFTDHLAKNIALLPLADGKKNLSVRPTSLFCCLRKREEGTLATGSGSDASNSAMPSNSYYFPFHLTTSIKLFRQRAEDDKSRFMLLTIAAQRILHVYKAPEETIVSTIFSTRHDPSCILVDADHNVVQHLGYLPQDMIGRSLFDFYHPEDLPFVKDVYETVVKMEGSPFRSKPYRFITQNGGYVILETEWSSFINPWSGKIEFVEGRHRVLRGPPNPDVLQRTDGRRHSLLGNISEEVFKECEIIQDEIRALLHERIQRNNVGDSELSSGPRDLVEFVENLLQEVAPPAVVSKKRVPVDDRGCFSKPEGVMLGVMSPEHDCSDSKSSTEPPVTYHELNYNDKIKRFFDSQPFLNASHPSDESNFHSSGPSNDENANAGGQSNDEIGKSSSNCTTRKHEMQNNSGESGSGKIVSSGSKNDTSHGSRGDSDNAKNENAMQPESQKTSILTEALLSKHTIDMEKLMYKQHKERKSTVNNDEVSKDSKIKESHVNQQMEMSEDKTKKRACKRRHSCVRDENGSKVSKYNDNKKTIDASAVTTTADIPVNSPSADYCQSVAAPNRSNVNTWPSVLVPVTSQPSPYFCVPSQNMEVQELPNCLPMPMIIPIYCVPLPRMREDTINSPAQPVPSRFQQNPYATSLISTSNPPSTMSKPFQTSSSVQRPTPEFNFGANRDENVSDRKPPASQATSVKAERCSSMAMSEFSKKLFSPGEHFSSCVSNDDGRASLVSNVKRETDTSSQFPTSLEDSSDSSFYGSFINSSTGSSCGPNQNVNSSQMNEQKKLSNSVKSLWKPTKITNDQRNIFRNRPGPNDASKMTNELIYRYQIKPKPLREVLKADLKALKRFDQPQLVNDQLAELYSNGGFSRDVVKFLVSDEDSSAHDQVGSSSSGDQSKFINKSKEYEEDSPLSEH